MFRSHVCPATLLRYLAFFIAFSQMWYTCTHAFFSFYFSFFKKKSLRRLRQPWASIITQSAIFYPRIQSLSFIDCKYTNRNGKGTLREVWWCWTLTRWMWYQASGKMGLRLVLSSCEENASNKTSQKRDQSSLIIKKEHETSFVCFLYNRPAHWIPGNIVFDAFNAIFKWVARLTNGLKIQRYEKVEEEKRNDACKVISVWPIFTALLRLY